MSIDKIPHADVAERSGWQCGMTHPENGRCARSCTTQDHHVIKRSEGGSDAPENRVLVCLEHHNMVHGDHFYRVLREGGYLYVEDREARGQEYMNTVLAADGGQTIKSVIDTLTPRGYQVWLLWPNISEAWETRYQLLCVKAEGSVRGANRHLWGIAQIGHELEYEGRLYTLAGYDDLGDWARDHRLAAKSVKSYVAAEARLRRIVPQDRWEEFREIPCTLWHQHGKAIEAGGLTLAEGLLEAYREGMPGPALAEMLAEGEAEAIDQARFTVRINAQDVAFEFTLPGPEAAAREAAIQRLVGMTSLDAYTVIKTTATEAGA